MNLPNGEHPLADRQASEQRAPFRAVGSGGRSARSLNNARCASASERTNSATVLGDNGSGGAFQGYGRVENPMHGLLVESVTFCCLSESWMTVSLLFIMKIFHHHCTLPASNSGP